MKADSRVCSSYSLVNKMGQAILPIAMFLEPQGIREGTFLFDRSRDDPGVASRGRSEEGESKRRYRDQIGLSKVWHYFWKRGRPK